MPSPPDSSENPTPLRDFLDPTPAADLWTEPALIDQYRHAIDVVDPEDSDAVAACFTSAYGHSPIRSGSYLRTPSGLRRFSPTEILRLMGFPSSFTLPPDLPRPAAWRLVGNSLSVPAVRHVLSAIRELDRHVATF
jgi:site-specific DNA-cytosine methylase